MGWDGPFPRATRLPADAYRNRETVFHVVLRAVPNTVPFRGGVGAAVWRAVLAERDRTAIELIAACLMPDHLHSIVQPRERGVLEWIDGFKSFTTREARVAGGSAFLWQPSFYDHRMRDSADFEFALAYLRRNPVAAGLVGDEAEWPWLWWSEALPSS